MRRGERGAGGIFIIVVLLLAMVLVAALFTLSRIGTNVDAQAQTTANLGKAAAAVEQFTGITGRLPCPANGSLDTGIEDRTAGSVSCNSPTGTVPWATIGMRRDDAFDAWGWKISYRVYSGAGGMTQDQGASMVNCDTSPTLGSAGVDANRLCRSTHATLPSEFISGKGLTVTDFGTVYDGTTASGGAAYVLVSHGSSGLGGYTAAGIQRDAPNSTDEKNNATATGPFTLEAASSPDVSSSDVSHFDDILLYRTVADLAKRANLSARDWPDGLASLVLNASTIQAGLGQSTAPVAGSSLGVSTLYLAGAQIAAGSLSGGQPNLLYATAGGTDGLGVFGGSGSGISGSEYITVTFAKSAGKAAISLAGFDKTESATLAFLRGGSIVKTVILQGCQSGTTGGGPLASFTLDPATSFDEIGVTSFPYSSTFLVSAVKSCDATDPTCVTALDNAANHCP